MSVGTKSRGFASMDAERQREIARKGGRAAHERGTAHEFTADEARAAGKKGGERVSTNREHMSRIGRLGGKSSAGRRSQIGAASERGHNQKAGNGSGVERDGPMRNTSPSRSFHGEGESFNNPDDAQTA